MSKKKKILITLPAFHDPGGVAAFYNSILPHLQSGEYNLKTLEIGSTKGRGNKLYPLSDQLRFYRSLISHKPDIVHVNPSLDIKSVLRDGLLIFQAKLKRTPVLVFFHGWGKDFEQVISKRWSWLFKLTFGQADAFIVLATEFKETLERWGVIQKIYLESTTVNESLLADFSISKKIARIKKSPDIKVLFLSRLEKEKGVFETIDAISLLIQKGLPVSLSIAGDGPIRAELSDYIRTKGLSEKHVGLIGYVRGADKINAFIEHDIYCFPTNYGEGLPTSVLEAMAFGMPVITKPVGGLADMFQDGKMGFLCKGESPAEIGDALIKLVTNRQLILQMSEYNYAFAKKHFMASTVAKRLINIYSSILGATKFEEKIL